MPIRQACPQCHVVLLLPDGGVGRCPQCQGIVRAEPPVPKPDVLEPIIPEISAEHEAGQPAEVRVTAESLSPAVSDSPSAPPPLPERRRRRSRPDDDLPPLEITHPLPKASKVMPITLLSIALIVSLLMVVGSIIYLVVNVKQQRPAPPPVIILPKK